VPAVQATACDALAAALVALRQLGWRCDADVSHRTPISPIVSPSVSWAQSRPTRRETGPSRAVVIGTVVFETALVALRRLAEAHYSARRFGEWS
jgi:hypothetical protein